MNKAGLLLLLYAIFLVAGLILSLLPNPTPLRRFIRVIAIILATPIRLCLCFIAIVAGIMFMSEPPSLGTLARQFSARKADLQTIVRMSDEDAHYSRIAMTFLDRDEQSGHMGRYMDGDPNAGLAKSR
jgi:hypothetical protein